MNPQKYAPPVHETPVSPNHALHQVKIFPTVPDSAAKWPRAPLLKRPLDILISSIMLLLSAPVSLFIAIAIKLEDGGPVFYRQKRWGRFGKTFMRSEEHTSELQSLRHLVCRLLLEKKNNKK